MATSNQTNNTSTAFLALFPMFAEIQEANRWLRSQLQGRGWAMDASETIQLATLNNAAETTITFKTIDNSWLMGIYLQTAAGAPIEDGWGFALQSGRTTMQEGGVQVVESTGNHLGFTPGHFGTADHFFPVRLPTSGEYSLKINNYSGGNFTTPILHLKVVDSNGYTFDAPGALR